MNCEREPRRLVSGPALRRDNKMDESASQHPHAPKGEIAKARAALLRFGDGAQTAMEADPADGYLKLVARQYNVELTRIDHQAAVVALANVSAKARGFVAALRELNKILPGYLDFESQLRLPDGRMRPTTLGVLPFEPLRESPGRDNFWRALEPELELPLSMRPANILRPTLERAEAIERLFADHSKQYQGDLKEKGPGKHNADRDGRTSKQMLAEVCYLIVAGRFRRAGAEMVMTTPASRAVHRLKGPDSVPLFAGFVRAMHIFARGTAVSESSLEKSVKCAATAMPAYVAERPELYGFILSPRNALEEATAKKGAEIFLRFLTDPAARPVVKAAS